MKAKYFLFVVSIVIGGLMFQSCGGSKKGTNLSGRKKIDMPCQGEDQSNGSTIRYLATATSPRIDKVKGFAERRGREGLAAIMSVTVKKLSEEYAKQYGDNTSDDFVGVIDEMSREVINQKVNGAHAVCNEMYEKKDGGYEYWVVMELDLNDFFNDMSGKMSEKEKMFIEWSKDKFADRFDEEFEKSK
jgi:ribosomal protein S17E